MPQATFRFAGMNNVLDAAQITRDEGERAQVFSLAADILNADPDATGKVRRRLGRRLVLAGAYHSLLHDSTNCYGVAGFDLRRISSDFQAVTLATLASSAPVHAVDSPIGLFYSNGTDIGLLNSGHHEALPTPATTVEVEGVSVPSFKEALPAGQYLAWYNGMLYSLRYENGESWLYHTDGYDLVWDVRDAYLRFAGSPTALVAVDDGMYVGAGGKLYFLPGDGPDSFSERRALDFAVTAGAFNAHRGEDLGLSQAGRTALFMTQSGFVLGHNGGQITQRDSIAPGAAQAGVLTVRQARGATHLVACLKGDAIAGNRYIPNPLDITDY